MTQVKEKNEKILLTTNPLRAVRSSIGLGVPNDRDPDSHIGMQSDRLSTKYVMGAGLQSVLREQEKIFK